MEGIKLETDSHACRISMNLTRISLLNARRIANNTESITQPSELTSHEKAKLDLNESDCDYFLSPSYKQF